MWSCNGRWVGFGAVGKGPGVLGAVLGPGRMVACELSIPVPQVALPGWQRGAQRRLGSVWVCGEGRHHELGARSCGAPVCVCAASPVRSGTVLAWFGSGCHP